MSTNNFNNLVSMVNQIAVNLGGGRDETAAAEATCRHLETFWARAMKQRLVSGLTTPETGLSPVAYKAATLLAERINERQVG